jgi:very-short-patch-repair endonuclease
MIFPRGHKFNVNGIQTTWSELRITEKFKVMLLRAASRIDEPALMSCVSDVSREYFIADIGLNRRSKFDFAWPKARVACEIDGYGYGKVAGAHQRPGSIAKDNAKRNAARCHGWAVLQWSSTNLSNQENCFSSAQTTVETVVARLLELHFRV